MAIAQTNTLDAAAPLIEQAFTALAGRELGVSAPRTESVVAASNRHFGQRLLLRLMAMRPAFAFGLLTHPLFSLLPFPEFYAPFALEIT